MRAIGVLKGLVPPLLWLAASHLLRGRSSNISYQGVSSLADLSALHQGRFARVYDAVYPNDPDLLPDGNLVRLRVYHTYLFAEIASRTLGDFLSVGVSYGVAPKVLYDLVLKGGKRAYHLVDPFTGKGGTGHRQDPADVMAQFGGDPLVRLHMTPAPQVFPIHFDDGLAFAELSTGDEQAELASLPYLIGCLNPGGLIVIDDYGWGPWISRYDEAAQRVGASIFSLPTGQGVLIKNGSRH